TGLALLLGGEIASGPAQLAAQLTALAAHEWGPRNAAVGLALEPESSRWWTRQRLRLSVLRTCTLTLARGLLLQEYRLRDVSDWLTSQGYDRVYRIITRLPPTGGRPQS